MPPAKPAAAAFLDDVAAGRLQDDAAQLVADSEAVIATLVDLARRKADLEHRISDALVELSPHATRPEHVDVIRRPNPHTGISRSTIVVAGTDWQPDIAEPGQLLAELAAIAADAAGGSIDTVRRLRDVATYARDIEDRRLPTERLRRFAARRPRLATSKPAPARKRTR